MDSSVVKLTDLALQEMGLIDQSDDFINPYKKQTVDKKDFKKIKFADDPDKDAKEKVKKKKKISKGPRLSRNEL